MKKPPFDLLGARDIGMGVTDSFAMTPAAAVSGFYFSHPDSTYFSVGKVGEDQAQDMLNGRRAAVGGRARAGAESVAGQGVRLVTHSARTFRALR